MHQYEMSVHADKGVSCLDCHQAVEGQTEIAHSGFSIAGHLTAANCRSCHTTEYEQYLRSRHAAPSWAAVSGARDFTAEQIAFGEQYHPGWVDRPANALAQLEGPSAITKGCAACHDIGKPNLDGSLGTCTACHARQRRPHLPADAENEQIAFDTPQRIDRTGAWRAQQIFEVFIVADGFRLEWIIGWHS